MRRFAKSLLLAAALTLTAPITGLIGRDIGVLMPVVWSFSASEARAYSEGDPRLNRWLGVNTRRVKWCGLYLAKIIKRPPRHAASVDAWRRWGRRVKPRPGVVVIFKHRHVGQLIKMLPGCALVRSGNDGNRVRTRCRKPSSISHYRAG
jgi:hypothetical protein